MTRRALPARRSAGSTLRPILPGWGPTGWVYTGQLALAEWLRIGQGIALVSRSLPAVVGDWLVYGAARYGESYAQGEAILAEAGYHPESLRSAQWVCERVSPARRPKATRYSHWREVAALEPIEQSRLLQETARRGWTVQQLREVIGKEASRGGGRRPCACCAQSCRVTECACAKRQGRAREGLAGVPSAERA